MNLVPFAVTELEGRGRLEDGGDGAAAVVDREGDCPINHLQDQVIASTLREEQIIFILLILRLNILLIDGLSCVATSVLRMRLLHAVAFSK